MGDETDGIKGTFSLWGTVVTPCHPSSGAGPMVPWHPGGPSGTIQSSGGKCPVPAANSEERCHEKRKRCHRPKTGLELGRVHHDFSIISLWDINGYCIFTLLTIVIYIYIVMGYLTIVMGKLNHGLTGFPSPGNHGWFRVRILGFGKVRFRSVGCQKSICLNFSCHQCALASGTCVTESWNDTILAKTVRNGKQKTYVHPMQCQPPVGHGSDLKFEPC